MTAKIKTMLNANGKWVVDVDAARRTDLERKNAVFNAMTPAEKRVAIAKDALEQLQAEKISPSTGDYICPVTEGDPSLSNVDPCMDLQDVLTDPGAPICKVCARGALFLSAVRVGDHFKVNQIKYARGEGLDDSIGLGVLEVLDDSDCKTTEQMYFEPTQVSLIESAFEGWQRPGSSSDSRLTHRWRFEFLHYDRLVGILENIIRNEGQFVLSDIPEAKPE